jgi:hypothetical protein
MSKRKEAAEEELRKWLRGICYESQALLIDDGQITLCKKCRQGAWLIEDIKHHDDCEVAEVFKNLNILTKVKE